MSKVVVISGHPNLEQSYTNSVILERLSASLDSVDIRRLDRLYPDYQIDVEAEQQALIDADVVVLQFPFYWYSVPALLKKWIDDVFSFNFAYGPEGDKLKGKSLFLSFTVGGPEESYDPLGYNHFTIEQMLRPLEQTAYLAGMEYRKPVYTHRMVYIPDVYNKLEEVQGRAFEHAERLISDIIATSASAERRIRRFVADWFGQFDKLPEDGSYFTKHLSPHVTWVMPEGHFTGHEGFRQWYQSVRKTFEPDCQHNVEQLDIKETEAGYEVRLRIQLIANTFIDSAMKGRQIDMRVNETWQIGMSDEGEIVIYDYRVDSLKDPK
ncbi:NAD(P)H-dependent oxidoreductase [Corallincola platygyrae]|uniref:NAD(P)H-dependent oxidoreductase n=1 Tax=Corallincola platygyrae TaxID=1193278 RepID=A0ABW4XL85_9GAMM